MKKKNIVDKNYKLKNTIISLDSKFGNCGNGGSCASQEEDSGFSFAWSASALALANACVIEIERTNNNITRSDDLFMIVPDALCVIAWW